MTIDRQQLIELLAQKTGLEREQIEEQLSELINKIKKAAEKGKTFEIKEFGTFSIVDDMLHFEPAEELKTEINHKYTGMEPIELIGAFGEGSAEEKKTKAESGKEDEKPEEATEEDRVWGLDLPEEEEEPAAEEPEKPTPQQQPAPGEEPEPPSPIPGEKDKPVPPPDEKEDEKEPKPPADRLEDEAMPAPPPGEPAGEEEAVGRESVKDDKTEEEEPKPKFQFDSGRERKSRPETTPKATQRSASRKTSPKSAEDEKDPIGTILTVFVIVAALAAAGWLVFDMGLIPGLSGGNGETVVEQQPPPPPQETQPEQQPQNDDINEPAPETQNTQQPSTEEQQPQATESEQPSPSQTEQQEQPPPPVYGLKGELNPEANDGYTIIVHSLRSESKARGIRDDLRNEGFRTILTQAVVRGTTYWRVGIGQFETVGDARDAVGNLQEPFRSNHFIKKIR